MLMELDVAQQEMKTDQLVTVIQTIQRARRSGLLEIRRNMHTSFIEEGTILFVNGKVQEAYTAGYQGPDAYRFLCQWQACSFTFTPSNPKDGSLAFPASHEYTSPFTEKVVPPRVPFIAVPPMRRPTPQERQDVPLAVPLRPLIAPSAVPVPMHERTIALQWIERNKLPRSRRQLLLLIDGQRSVGELLRLSGRSQEEMEQMLYEMEQGSIIIIRR